MTDAWELLAACTSFQWGEGNADKNRVKHGVSQGEREEVFFNNLLLMVADRVHSKAESRYYALGRTDEGRKLFVVFTLRGTLVRVISARDMSREERKEYGRAQGSEASHNP